MKPTLAIKCTTNSEFARDLYSALSSTLVGNLNPLCARVGANTHTEFFCAELGEISKNHQNRLFWSSLGVVTDFETREFHRSVVKYPWRQRIAQPYQSIDTIYDQYPSKFTIS